MSTTSQQIHDLVNRLPFVAAPLLSLLEQLNRAMNQGPSDPAGFAQAEQALGEKIIQLNIAAHLQLLDTQAAAAEVIKYNGERWRRLDASGLRVLTPYGRGTLARSLYRQVGVANGPTIDPVTLRAGLLEGMTPAAARLVSALQASVPSREGEDLMKQLQIKLPRSTIERGSAHVASEIEDGSDDMEDDLIKDFELPDEAVAVALSVDRVNLPYEEPVKRPARRPRKSDPKRPCQVVYHLVYCACWTLFDAEGEPLYTCRYAQEPGDEGSVIIEDELRSDLKALLGKRADLKVVTLSDGAPEMLQMLDRVVEGIEVAICLVDFWHAFSYIVAALVALDKNTPEEKKRIKRSLLESESGPQKVLMKLRTWAIEHEGEAPEKVEDAIRYLGNRIKEGKMKYAAARREQLPVGSGHVEATCKAIVSTRMKRAGSRWKRGSAGHVLWLRSLFTSSRHDEAHAWLVKRRQMFFSPLREIA